MVKKSSGNNLSSWDKVIRDSHHEEAQRVDELIANLEANIENMISNISSMSNEDVVDAMMAQRRHPNWKVRELEGKYLEAVRREVLKRME